jgi:hypothetical protein
MECRGRKLAVLALVMLLLTSCYGQTSIIEDSSPLDGSARTERVTLFSNYAGYKASNPVVSDDGRYMAFQVANRGDMAGVGRGILIFDLESYEKAEK